MCATLKAIHDAYGWSVIDSDGGRWTPNEDAATEIEQSNDPAATAVMICDAAPMRGKWAS